jgi:nucleotidyltransferase/DNA polymerase involved in DNA repair
VLPGYESSFLSKQPISILADLPAQAERALRANGFALLGDLAGADQAALAAVVGRALAARLLESVSGEAETPVSMAAPPTWLQEEARVRDTHADPIALGQMLRGLADRAARRLRPFGLAAEVLTVEVARGGVTDRRSSNLARSLSSGEALGEAALRLAEPILEPAASVKAIALRLSRLRTASREIPLFPLPGSTGWRAALL